MLGREKVNNLFEYVECLSFSHPSLFSYFKIKYGSIDTIEYQKARNNFIKSMAAYSVITYILQFKDRHNGNIMIDEEGHIIHIGKDLVLV